MKTFRFTLFTIATLLCSIAASAHDFEVDGIYYKITSSSILTVSVTYQGSRNYEYTDEYTGTVTIPESVAYNGNTYSVTSIGESAFSECSGLTSITIPESVTSIGESAFGECSGLTSITIPESLTSIGDYAFYGCSGLTSIIVNEDNDTYDSRDNCNAIIETNSNTLISGCASTVIPNSVTSIGYYAFYGCSGLTSITIPNSVTSIGECAFNYCDSLATLVIGTGVTDIGYGGYRGTTPAKTIWLTNTPPEGYRNLAGRINYVANEQYTYLSNTIVYPYLSSMFEVDGITYVPVNMTERTCDAIDILHDTSVENTTINSTVSFKGVTMTVKEVMPYIGYNNEYIKNLTISNLGSVGEYALEGCTNLKTVTASNQGNIGQAAFSGCTSLQTANVSLDINTDTSNSVPITLNDWTSTNHGSSSTSSETYTLVAGDGAYLTFDWSVSSESGCDWLVVTLDGTTILKKSGSNSGTYSDALNEGEHTLVLKYTKDNSGSSGSDQASVTNINTMGWETVGRIGSEAFYDCSNLQEVTLSESVTSIGISAFYGCSSLPKITIPNSVTAIGEYVFSGCSSLTGITIPNSVTSIGDYAFDNCTSLANLTISDRTEALTLGSNGSSPLFADCPLDFVYIGGKIAYNTSSSYGYSPFYRNASLRAVTISNAEDEIYDNEFYGCTNLKVVSIGDGVKKIGAWAFSGCSSLDRFSFGDNVESIGQEAFSDCTNMTQLNSSAITPPVCGAQALEDINKWNCTLKVPEGYTTAYQAADQWKDFFFIEDVLGGQEYQLIYLVDGEIYQTEYVIANTALVAPEVPTKEGYTFSGWNNLPETMPAQDVTVEGTFTVNSYTLLYIVDGEEYKKVEVAYGDAIEAEAEPTKEGYIFSGWSEIPETMPANDVTVTGSFEVNGIEDITVNKLVDVYTLQGVKVKEQIPMNSLNEELPRGIYIVKGKKMIVK